MLFNRKKQNKFVAGRKKGQVNEDCERDCQNAHGCWDIVAALAKKFFVAQKFKLFFFIPIAGTCLHQSLGSLKMYLSKPTATR